MTKEYSVTTNLLSPNPYSRSQRKLNKIKGIVIHWVANPKTSAIANRNYFENRKHSKTGYGSAHEIIGLNGEIVKCIPDNEMAYHVGSKTYTKKALTQLSTYPNNCTYGIECTHLDWSGKFNTKTYTTLINRVTDLCVKFNLAPSKDTIWRHYDVVGWKDCPRYYVKNPNAWDKLISDVTKKYNEKINKKTNEVIEMALANWQKEMGEKAIGNLVKKGIVNNPEQWEKTLGIDTPQWLFWSIIDRITKGVK